MFRADLRQIAEITGGRLAFSEPGLVVQGLSTDSRQVRPGQLFVALKGDRFDGHDYVDSARQAGAAAALVEREVSSPIPQVVVDDTLIALGKLGQWWRSLREDLIVVAVTGSAGKTTTKGMTASILARRGPTLSNRGTENNEIGLPSTLLRLANEEYCVLEMGSRGLGQIDYLAQIARPSVGVITNIGEAHLGVIGGREKIAQAKSELIAALPATGTVVLNREDYFFGLLSEMAPCQVLSFGLSEGDFRAESIHTCVDGTSFVLVGPPGRKEVRLRSLGRHNVLNALAAAAASWACGARGPHIVAGLEAFRGEALRTQIFRREDGTLIVNDAYNASPTSVGALLDLVHDMPGRKVFVFGDMLELGDYAQVAHERVAQQAQEAGIQVLVAVGELGALTGAAAERLGLTVAYARDAEEAAWVAVRLLQPGDVVLVKASRLVGLERVAEYLAEGRARSD